jgi:hypothetical protein
MTTNEQITAKAGELATLIQRRMSDDFYHIHLFYQPEVWRRADETAEAVRGAVDRYTALDIAPIEQMLASLAQVFGGSFGNPLADPARGYVDDVASHLTDWYGTAAEAFRMNFLNPYPQIRENQIALVRELALVLEGYRAVVEQTRAKVVELCDQAIAVLNALGSQAAVPLTIAATVVAVIGAVATAPASIWALAGGLALLGGGLSVAATVAGETPTPGDAVIHGGNADEVVRSIYAALALLDQDAANANAKLVAALQHDLALVQQAQRLAAGRNLNLFIPYRPAIVDSSTGGSADGMTYHAPAR